MPPARNPSVIYASVSAYGRSGPHAGRMGFDPIVQAESGFMSMNGYPDQPPVRAGPSMMDISTAMMTCNAILAAVVARERTGIGQSLEVALYDNAFLLTGYTALQDMYTGVEQQRPANTSPDTCPSGVFYASDSAFLINCGNTGIFQRLMTQVVELPDLAADPRYSTNKDRVARRPELFALLQEVFGRQPWAHWQTRMRAASVPCGELRSPSAAIRAPEAQERGIITRIPHPTLGWVPHMRSPIRYATTPVADPTPAPRVGEHTRAVVGDWLGYDAVRVEKLAESGAFGAQK